MDTNLIITKAEIVLERDNNSLLNSTTSAIMRSQEGVLRVEAMLRGDPDYLQADFSKYLHPGEQLMPTRLAVDKDLINILAELTRCVDSLTVAVVKNKRTMVRTFQPIFIDSSDLDNVIKRSLLYISKTLSDIKEVIINHKE